MSKAVLVMDMPDSCDKCPLFNGYYSDMSCGGSHNRTIDYPYPKDFRQDWCPLKELPTKENGEIKIRSDEYSNGFIDGFNSCLDEIYKPK